MQYSVVLQQPLETITFPCHLFYCLLYRELTLNPRKWVTNAKTVLSQSTSECSIFSLRGIHSPLTALPPHYFFFWNAYSQCQRLMSRQPRQAVAGYFALLKTKNTPFFTCFEIFKSVSQWPFLRHATYVRGATEDGKEYQWTGLLPGFCI